MGLRLDLDLRQGPTVPRVERSAEGALHLRLTHRQDAVALHLSYPSLEALWWELTAALAELRAS
jgi:hypothetical protein